MIIHTHKLVPETTSYLSLKRGKSIIRFFLGLEGHKSITRRSSGILLVYNICRNNSPGPRVKKHSEIFRRRCIGQVCDKQVKCYWLFFHWRRCFLLSRPSIFESYHAAFKLLRSIHKINKYTRRIKAPFYRCQIVSTAEDT